MLIASYIHISVHTSFSLAGQNNDMIIGGISGVES